MREPTDLPDMLPTEATDMPVGDGAEPERRTRLPKKAWIWLVATLAVLALSATGYAAYARRPVPSSRLAVAQYEAGELSKVLDPAPSRIATQPVYILLIGDDRRAEPQARSDGLILARIDPVKKSVVMLSIPRDTRVPIPGHGVSKINAAHSWGGPPLAIQTVKDFTGLPVNHYVVADFGGLTDLVDVMGGISIDVDREINDEYRKNDQSLVWHIDKGYQKLNGAQALTYVRSRWFPEGDFVRCLHQRTFLKALATAALEASPTRRMLLVALASKDLKSDMSIAQILDLANAMKGVDPDAALGRTVPGKDTKINGIWFTIPNQQRTRELVGYVARGEVPPGAADWGYE
jgi:LCP family protein required for cell wall assembly